jgi:hypothetical protein
MRKDAFQSLFEGREHGRVIVIAVSLFSQGVGQALLKQVDGRLGIIDEKTSWSERCRYGLNTRRPFKADV